MKKLGNDWSIVQTVVIVDNYDKLNYDLTPIQWYEWSVTGYLIKREYAKYLIERTYLSDTEIFLDLPYGNIVTVPALPEELIYRHGIFYNKSFAYPLSIPLFVEKEKYNSNRYHRNSTKHVMDHYMNQ